MVFTIFLWFSYGFCPIPHELPEIPEDILHLEGMPRFIVEVGSLHGHSAIQMATVLDQLQMTEAAIVLERSGKVARRSLVYHIYI